MQSEEILLKKKIAIIGLGLIGGSIAKALKKSEPNIYISAFDKPEILAKAIYEKTIDCSLQNYKSCIEYDIIFLCLPLEQSLLVMEEIAPLAKDNTLITDVCGVKGAFEKKWDELQSKGCYIGGHPMTGKEKGGYDNSDALLFENAVYILSETGNKSPQMLDMLIELIKILGARIRVLNSYEHDKVVANVSHLPQLLSVALVNNAAQSDGTVNNLDFAAGGFRDMTRIASSSFNIWESVIKYNKSEILETLENLQTKLSDIYNYIEKDDTEKIGNMFVNSAEKRDSIPKNTKGFINPLYDIFVYVQDRPGVLLTITSSLFSFGIDIKDMELLKIREGSGGTFKLSFVSYEVAVRSAEILRNNGFQVDL